MLSLFMFHEVRNLGKAEEKYIISKLVSLKKWNNNRTVAS